MTDATVNTSSPAGDSATCVIWHPPGLTGHPCVDRLQQIADRVPAGDQRFLVALAPAPRAALCVALDGGTAPETALEDFLQSLQGLMEQARRFDLRTVIVSLEDVASAPAALLEYLGLDSTDAEPNGPFGTVLDTPDGPALDLDVVAQVLLMDQSELPNLLAELEARSVDLSNGTALHDSTLSAKELHATYLARQDLSDALAQQEATSAALKKQVRQAEKAAQDSRAQLERQAATQALRDEFAQGQQTAEAALRNELTEAQQATAEAQQAADANGAAAAELREERNLLVEQITQFREETDISARDMAALRDELSEARTSISDKNKKLQKLSQRKKDMQAALAANKVKRDTVRRLEERLRQLDQGMESYEAQLKTAEADKASLTKAKAELEGKIKELSKALKWQKSVVEMRDAELSAIRGSRSYRAMGPLRALRGVLSRGN